MTDSGAAHDAAVPPHAADVVRRYLAMLETGGDAPDGALAADLENDFVRCAAAFGRQHGLSFADWRRAGVGAEVLWRAGITGVRGEDE